MEGRASQPSQPITVFFTMLALSVAVSGMENSQVMSLAGWYILLNEKSEQQLKKKYHRTFKILVCVKLSLIGSVLVALLKVCETIFICLVM